MVLTQKVSRKKQKPSYGRTVKILSPAKLNLYLNILGKYASGYHKLESIVERISLCDKITLRLTKGPAVRFKCNKKFLETSDNLCVKAALLAKKKLKLNCGFDIFLLKKIPVGAGLGGGSSNAAAVLLAIDRVLNLGLSQAEFFKLGAKLGSDVNFFLSGAKYAFMFGRGEKIKPFKAKTLRHIVIWPGKALSTASVYKAKRLKLTKFLQNAKIIAYGLKKGDIDLVKQNIYNALEKSALSLCAEISAVKKILDKQGIFCRVTGSGSALYTIGGASTLVVLRRMLPARCELHAVSTF